MSVKCDICDCIYCNGTDTCIKSDITITGDDGCLDYKSYLSISEYKQEYWKAMRLENGEMGRELAKGKKLSINGETFYTQSKENEIAKKILLTHARTGALTTLLDVRKKWGEFKEFESILKNVEEYPIVQRKFINGKLEYVKQKEN